MGYALGSIVLIAAYPVLPEPVRSADLLAVSLAAIPATVVGLRRTRPGDRRSWWLLLTALILVNIANLIGLRPGGVENVLHDLTDTAGAILFLAAAIALVIRRGRNGWAAIIDTAAVALALGALLWDTILAPHLADGYQSGTLLVRLFVTIFALCGILAALGQLLQMMARPMAALWLLTAAAGLALASYVVLAVAASANGQSVLAVVLLMAVYATIGLFALDPSAPRLTRAGSGPRREGLSGSRLVFLGIAGAVIPIVVGIRALRHGSNDGLILAIAGPAIIALVILRLAHVSAQRDRAEMALRHEAVHDPLTGLLNRREFVKTVRRDLANRVDCAVLFCDLNGFKAVNDRYGHQAGDELLVEVAQHLRESARTDTVVSRFGGDEFAILLRDPSDAEIENVSKDAATALSHPVQLHGEQVSVTASIGAAVANGDTDPEKLIARADEAMYDAKRNQPYWRAAPHDA
jgi:diguanylate cyclase (GGDEF)-like protein